MRRLKFVVAATALSAVMTVDIAAKALEPEPGGASGSAGDGGFGIVVTNGERRAHGGTNGGSDVVVDTRVINCGPSKLEGRQVAIGSNRCAEVWLQCDVSQANRATPKDSTDLLVLTTYKNGVTARDVQCNVQPNRAQPQVTAAMARAAAEKLLPHPAIGSAPIGDVTLVNIETVLWVDTLPDRTLGTVTLLGHRVTLRAHLERVGWDFGDDSTDISVGPGKRYTNADPCRTAQCPGYFGHTYLRTGRVTVAADLTWTGQFRVDNGGWQAIPGTVTAPATSDTIRVKEARGVLIPDS
jgi:hypothetical protein